MWGRHGNVSIVSRLALKSKQQWFEGHLFFGPHRVAGGLGQTLSLTRIEAAYPKYRSCQGPATRVDHGRYHSSGGTGWRRVGPEPLAENKEQDERSPLSLTPDMPVMFEITGRSIKFAEAPPCVLQGKGVKSISQS